MNIFCFDFQRLAIESGVVVALAYIDNILLDISADNKQRLLAATNA